jgi:AP-3 complex subunit beta
MGKALVRIHRDRREIQYVVLSSIRTLATVSPSAFAPFLHDFFVKAMDPPFTRHIKLDILTSLALEPKAIETVLKELRTYVRDEGDADFVCAAVRAVGRVAEMARIVYDRHGSQKGTAVADRAEANRVALNCLFGLTTLTQTCQDSQVVGEAVQVMQFLLQILTSDGDEHGGLFTVHDPNRVQERALRRVLILLVNTLSSPARMEDGEGNEAGDESDDEEPTSLEKICLRLPAQASASAIWLMGEYLAPLSSVTGSKTFGKFDAAGRTKLKLELVRLLAGSFPELDAVEKEQAVHFATKLLISNASSSGTAEKEGPLCEQILSMARVDVNTDVRDRARFESHLLRVSIGLQHDLDALEAVPSLGQGQNISLKDTQRLFLQNKPAPSSLPVEDDFSTQMGEKGGFRFGTLSSLVGHQARSAYLPLPPWAAQNSPSSLREEVKEKIDGGEWKNGTKKGRGGFYESSDEESTSTSSSSESSESSSGASSGSESDEESSGTSSEEEDSGSSDSSESQDDVLLPLERSTKPSAMKPNGPSIPVPASVAVESVSNESSSGGESDESSSDDESAEELFPKAAGTLIPMGIGAVREKVAAPTKSSSFNGSSSVAEDMKGLVLAPVVVDADAKESLDPNMERDSGAWLQLVRPEHAGGLSVQARYLRGVTKAQQAQLMGLTAEKPTIVCVQLQFENQKKNRSNGSLRHVRILQRSSASSSSVIGPRKVVLPPEITCLAIGQKTECVIGIDFASASDRDGSLLARLDIKYGGGGIPVEIKPSIGDVLMPCKRTIEEFDADIRRMQGFQRIESSFSVPPASRSEVPRCLLSTASLSSVGKTSASSWKDDNGSNSTLRWAGTLPASSDPVYVMVSCSSSGEGKITVCCDHALVVSTLMNLLKKSIRELQG